MSMTMMKMKMKMKKNNVKEIHFYSFHILLIYILTFFNSFLLQLKLISSIDKSNE